MSRRRLNKADRGVLVVLVVLLLLFVVHLWWRSDRSDSEVLAAKAQSSDTLPVEPAEQLTIVAEPSVTALSPPDTLPVKTDKYPGPPKRAAYQRKLQKGAQIDLNSADTLLLQRVPGIGPSFARRIAKYRQLLGGYYCVEQLQEVYGVDRPMYDKIAPFFKVDTKPMRLDLSKDTIPRHPYLSWQMMDVIKNLSDQYEVLTWSILMESGAFTQADSMLLDSYLPLPYTRVTEEQSVVEDE
ncbi:MAG: helix-hairpin-helix domain-containing protein [Porphyromonas sp.]|nr:helix-hairpin-helix domain-containing protein [Porphyromonas sp.]